MVGWLERASAGMAAAASVPPSTSVAGVSTTSEGTVGPT